MEHHLMSLNNTINRLGIIWRIGRMWLLPVLVVFLLLSYYLNSIYMGSIDYSKSPEASTRLLHENRLDLNHFVYDAGRYNPSDNWFTNRWQDIISIGRISHNEAVAVSERLLTLNNEQFNDQLWKLAATSMSTTMNPHGDMINNFLTSLDKYQPASLSEICIRIASSLKGEKARSVLFKKLRINSWMLLLTTIEQNPETDTGATFKATFIDALGGHRDFGAMLFFNHYKAIVCGDLDAALMSVKLAAAANRIFPDSLPEYVSSIASSDDKSVEKIVKSFEGLEDTEKIGLVSSVIWGFPGRRSEQFDYFSSFAKREFDFGDEEFENLAHEILYLQLGDGLGTSSYMITP